MSVFFRGHQGTERRWLNGGPGAGGEFLSDGTPAIPANSATGGYGGRSLGIHSSASALQKIAIFSSVNLLATIAEMLPHDVYTGTGQDKRKITTPTWLANLGGNELADTIWQMVFCWGLRGNVAGKITARDSVTGIAREVALAHPDTFAAWRSAETGRVTWRLGGKQLEPDEVWHRRVFPVPGSILGLSPIALHALTIGTGLAAEQFGAQFFLDGAHPSAVLTQKDAKEMPQGVAKVVKERFLAATRGNREPVVMAGGWEYHQIQIAPNESQFLETQKYTDAQCARIYGPGMPEILGYETGGSMTYSNIEQRSLDLLTYTADPWLVRVERALTALLPRPQYFRFERKALVRSDILTRFQVHQIALRNRIETHNEVREVEDLPPVPWGDVDPGPADPSTLPVPVTMES